MEPSVITGRSSTPTGGEGAVPAAESRQALPRRRHEQLEAMISAEIPAELQQSARGLLRAVAGKVAVAEHFDAFCGQAFSKPEWAAAASPLIAELFDHDEDQLAELARIPDLVVEMGSGQATVTCMVASRWAARGETHRLSRLAESIVASRASKNACAVEVMLALAATLAVRRFSKAEQLYNAALPLVGEEHQEALADARRWLAAGRVVCSASQEERDFWDVRLRKPRTAWTWQGKQERAALQTLSERLACGAEGADFFQAVVPPCWWDLAMKCAQQQEKLADVAGRQPLARPVPFSSSRAASELPAQDGAVPQQRAGAHPQAGPHARFVLGWVCGAMAMVITLLLLPAGMVNRVLVDLSLRSTGPQATAAVVKAPGTGAGLVADSPAEKLAWREENRVKIAQELAPFASVHAAAKAGRWSDSEQVLSGAAGDLPPESPQQMKMLVWLHLDPPRDAEARLRIARLLLQRTRADAITLWEELCYPGSANMAEIKQAAKEALADASLQWSADETKRLQMLADAATDAGPATAPASAAVR